jgi:hypothetical protein
MVGLGAGWLAWRHRESIASSWRREMTPSRLAALTLGIVVVAALGALAALSGHLGAVANSAVPVLASLAVLVVLELASGRRPALDRD